MDSTVCGLNSCVASSVSKQQDWSNLCSIQFISIDENAALHHIVSNHKCP